MPPRTKIARRDAANLMALLQGVPTTQEGIDAMHSASVERLNASVAAHAKPSLRNGRGLLPLGSSSTPAPRPGSAAPRGQAEIDAMHAEIATRLNREAGFGPRPRRHG